MTTGKTVAASAGATVTAQAGTSAALPVVPFLDMPLITFTMNGFGTSITPQVIIVVLTGILSIGALMASIYSKIKLARKKE